jgi:tripartite-type tricarboxylate transporter receptor subunit TctC
LSPRQRKASSNCHRPVGKLKKEINAALAEPGTKSRFADIGGSVVGGSSTDFAKLVSDETEKWGKVIRAAHIKAE